MASWAPNITETHVSTLIMVGDRVYKLKKPVRMPFIDLSTREAREAMCRREVELNRRMAPDVYLGVADVSGPDGRPCDHLVVMKRMPEGRRLSDLLRAGEDVDVCVDAVTDLVAAFHGRAIRSAATDLQGTIAVQREKWKANLSETNGFVGRFLARDRYERIERSSETYLAGREALFEARIAAGRIRDCHGDMLADDVYCLDDGPRILDCLEFDDRMRYIDVLDDVACLAMDLERAGGTSAAARLTTRYRKAMDEDAPDSLLHYFIAYRAFMRAKIACMRAVEHERGAAERADRLLRIADEHLAEGRIRMVMIGGLPGTGKTTAAMHLQRSRGWEVLRSDVTRKELVGVEPGTRSGDPYMSGLYKPGMTDDTYRALVSKAGEELGIGRSVVIDASWSREEHRQLARDVARRTHSELREIRCVLDPHEAERRIEQRRRRGTDASDADAAVARRMALDFDPWPEAIEWDTSATIDDDLDRVLG